jgi:hypothetical protein
MPCPYTGKRQRCRLKGRRYRIEERGNRQRNNGSVCEEPDRKKRGRPAATGRHKMPGFPTPTNVVGVNANRRDPHTTGESPALHGQRKRAPGGPGPRDLSQSPLLTLTMRPAGDDHG